MKIYLFALPILLFLFDQECKENLDLLPMYGGVEKCVLQQKQDSIFIAQASIKFDTRTYAAHHYKNLGWEFLESNQLDHAMKQFNLSWLLDNSTYQCYWGFANILGKRENYKEAVKYFDIARKFNPEFAEFYLSAGSANGKLYESTRNISHLKMAISDFEKSASINGKNGEAYAQLTACYYNLEKKELALKYLKLSDAIDMKLTHPQLRKELVGK